MNKKENKYLINLKSFLDINISKDFEFALKLFATLLFSTISLYLLMYFASVFTDMSFWYFSEQKILMKELFRPWRDGSYFEQFQYILLFWCFLLSSYYIFISKIYSAISIPITYIFLLVDDFCGLHDKFVGNYIENLYIENSVNLLGSEFIRVKDHAEITYWIVATATTIFISSIALYKSSRSRKFILCNFSFFALLGFFAVFMDVIAVKSNVRRLLPTLSSDFHFWLSRIFQSIEEFGELITISLICIWLFSLCCSFFTRRNTLSN